MLDFTEFKAIVEKVDPTKTPHESSHLFRMIMDKEDGEVMGLDAFCDVMQQAGLDRAFNQKHVTSQLECLPHITLGGCTLHEHNYYYYDFIIIQLRAQGLGLTYSAWPDG
jgi:hypothetical protein